MSWNVQQAEYQPVVGLESIYVAKVTQDDAAGFAVDTPQYLAPAAEAKQAPEMSSETKYYDNAPFAVTTSRGATKIDLSLSMLPAEVQAALTGGTFDAASGRVFDNEGVPDYYALGFKSKKLNGSYRFYWFLKGQFTPPSEEAATETDKPDVKNASLTYTAIRTTHKFEVSTGVNKKVKRVYGDEDTANFSGTTWFSSVQVPGTTAYSALALSSSTPAANATGISISANQTLTFNNALPSSQTSNIKVWKVSDGSAVAAAVTLDTAKKVATVNPDSNLAGTSEYMITYAVTDIYGQTLNGVVHFTTV